MTEDELIHQIVLNRHAIEELNYKLQKAKDLLIEWKNSSSLTITSYILRLETEKLLGEL